MEFSFNTDFELIFKTIYQESFIDDILYTLFQNYDTFTQKGPHSHALKFKNSTVRSIEDLCSIM